MCICVYEQIFHLVLVEFENVKNTFFPNKHTVLAESRKERTEEVKVFHLPFSCFTKHEKLKCIVSGCTGKQMQGCEDRSPEAHLKCVVQRILWLEQSYSLLTALPLSLITDFIGVREVRNSNLKT